MPYEKYGTLAQLLIRKLYGFIRLWRSYKEKTDVIINRKGDGICPMEETVLNVSDHCEGIELLKNKVKLLREASRKE